MPTGTPDQVAVNLARKLAAYDADSLPALVTAIRASGFTILTPDRKMVAGPMQQRGNGIYVEDEEIIRFFRMSIRGYRMSASGLCDGIDYAFTESNLKPGFKSNFSQSFAMGSESEDPGTRFFSRFLIALGQSLPSSYDLSKPQDLARAWITPVESFLIMRSFTEELRGAVKIKHKNFTETSLSAGGPHEWQQTRPDNGEVPGYRTDLAAEGRAFIWGQVVQFVADLRGVLAIQEYLRYLAVLNACIGTMKVYATYMFLETEWSVLAPGAPLTRTHESSSDGQERTIQAKLRIDPEEWAKFFNEWRLHIVGWSAIDTEMPKIEKLANIGVSWKLPDYTSMATTLEKPVQLRGDIEHAFTDSEGVTQVVAQGVRQKVRIPESAPPVKKSVRVWVIPAVKNNDMAQAFVDSVSGLAGFAAGPIAMVTVIQEMVLRGKWMAPQLYNLPIIDWNPGSLKIAFSIDVKGSGVIGKGKNKTTWSVDRTYIADGWLVPASNASMPQVARELDNITGARLVFNFTRNSDRWNVNDKEERFFEAEGCAGEGKTTGYTKETFVGPLGDARGHFSNNRKLNYVYDFTSKRMFLDIREPTVDGVHTDFAKMNNKVTRNVVEDIAFGLFPERMTRAAAPRPLGYTVKESADPTELEEGGVITGEYSYRQPYKNGFLTLNYKYLIKPSVEDQNRSISNERVTQANLLRSRSH